MQQQKLITIVFGIALCGLMFVTHAGATQPTYSVGRRLALVFGNNQYTQLTDLVKAVNDATAMVQELTAAGFQVINIDKYSDLDRRAMLDARDELMKELNAGDQVVVFYAGHGVQIGSEIYLIPVSFPLLTVASAERVAEESVTLQSIMDAVKKRIGADGFALYIVDACRNNPLPKTAGRSIPQMLHRGLVPMQPPAGQIAIYAASNGQEALDTIKNDDPDPNGVFTRVLLKHIKKPGEPIMDILIEVQEEVIQLAKQVIDEDGNAHEQQPAIYNEARLKRPFCFYPNEYGCVQVQVVVPSVLPVVPTVVIPKLVQLTIKSNIKSGQDQVLIDGENRGSTQLVVDLEPGIHNVQVTAAGFNPWEKELELTVGTPYSVYAKLESVIAEPTNQADSAWHCAVFEHANYEGNELRMETGEDIPWVGDDWNDIISSTKSKERCFVIGYEHIDFGGGSKQFIGRYDYVGDGWNDQISSMRCRCEP